MVSKPVILVDNRKERLGVIISLATEGLRLCDKVLEQADQIEESLKL